MHGASRCASPTTASLSTTFGIEARAIPTSPTAASTSTWRTPGNPLKRRMRRSGRGGGTSIELSYADGDIWDWAVSWDDGHRCRHCRRAPPTGSPKHRARHPDGSPQPVNGRHPAAKPLLPVEPRRAGPGRAAGSAIVSRLTYDGRDAASRSPRRRPRLPTGVRASRRRRPRSSSPTETAQREVRLDMPSAISR